MILVRREEPRNKRCFALMPSQAKYLYNEYGKKRKSVPWSWFEENTTELDRLAKPVRWNLTKLFNDLI